ncbi:ATP synthase subunit I [Halolactibacillus sp. JCM 19043]|nr:ATP synthase subunit I [Halolactibacillus sp. JCM 19043]
METYHDMTKKHHHIFLVILISISLVTLLTQGHPILFGLLLGGVVSYVNLCLLQWKVTRLVRVVTTDKRFATAGTILRIGAALLVVALVENYFTHIPILAVIIGLMFKYVVVLIAGFWSLLEAEKFIEKGE